MPPRVWVARSSKVSPGWRWICGNSRSSTPEEAERLEIAEGAPVLDVWRRCYDQNERILELTRRVINPALHRLIYRYP